MKEFLKKDFDLCCQLSEKFSKMRGGATPAYEYPEQERIVILVWYVTGVIENGGFHYLFESPLPGDPHYQLTVEAFKKIGCIKASDIIQRALSLFPGRIPQDNDRQRIICFEKQPEELRDSLDSEFWKECDQVTISLAKYIRDNNLDK